MAAYQWIAENWSILLVMWAVWSTGFLLGAFWAGAPRDEQCGFCGDADGRTFDGQTYPTERTAQSLRGPEQRRIAGPSN